SVQRELRSSEKGATGIEEGAVHFTFGVIEDAKMHDFFGHGRGGRGVIFAADGKEDHEASANLADDVAVNDYAGAGDALDDGSHGKGFLTGTSFH
ncbi:MAG: hypothetical protein WBL66_10985, partial [Candidatus Acidiferrales bacterium]